MTVYSNIQFVKSGQKISAGPPLPPSFGQNPNEQLLFFVKPSHILVGIFKKYQPILFLENPNFRSYDQSLSPFQVCLVIAFLQLVDHFWKNDT